LAPGGAVEVPDVAGAADGIQVGGRKGVEVLEAEVDACAGDVGVGQLVADPAPRADAFPEIETTAPAAAEDFCAGRFQA
jgi:hypothetical protein